MATQKISDIMTRDPISLDENSTALQAAETMRQHGIGDVVVLSAGAMCGLVTDRDLVVRVLAEGRDPAGTPLRQICSAELATVGPQDDVADAVALIRQRAVRRIPVVENGRTVGIVSIGDLALERDGDSALAEVSMAPPNT
jgi:CBS domain-containing protein